MRFPNCMLLSLAIFAGVYVSWLGVQLKFGRDLERFDAGEPSFASREEKPAPRTVPAQIVRARQPDTAAAQAQRVDSSVGPQIARQREMDTPAPPQRDSTSQQGTYGFAIKQLDLLFESDMADQQFLRLIREQGCEIVAVKVEHDTIVDAFLPGAATLLQRAEGPLASYKFDQFRAEHPLNRHFWIRWQEVDDPIARQAAIELERHGLIAPDYFLYMPGMTSRRPSTCR